MFDNCWLVSPQGVLLLIHIERLFTVQGWGAGVDTQNYLDSIPSPRTDPFGTEPPCFLENLDIAEVETDSEAQVFKVPQSFGDLICTLNIWGTTMNL